MVGLDEDMYGEFVVPSAAPDYESSSGGESS